MKCRQLTLVFFTFLLILTSCHKREQKVYRIGVDPTFFPVQLIGKEPNMLAFTTEVMQEIGRLEKVRFERVTVSWDRMIEGLKSGQYEGMLSSIYPHIFQKKKFSFSVPLLETGPVLVMRKGEGEGRLRAKEGLVVGVTSYLQEAYVLKPYPDVTVKTYPAVSEVLEAVFTGEIDAAAVGLLPAMSYIHDIYHKSLHIASPPLHDSAIRLMTLSGQNQDLLKLFDRGLNKMHSSGKLDEIATKWQLKLNP